jgi:hypothetical protein
LKFLIAVISILVTVRLKIAIDQSSYLPSHAFPAFRIEAPPEPVPESKPEPVDFNVSIRDPPSKDPRISEMSQREIRKQREAKELQIGQEQKLIKKNFKEAQITKLDVPSSKKQPQKNKWNTDDDQSWRIEYSDKGSDGDDVSLITPTKRNLKKPLRKLIPLDSSEKGTVSEADPPQKDA